MDHPTIEELRGRCAAGDPSRQVAAIVELVELVAVDAIPTLVELLEDPDSVVRFAAVQALITLGTRDIGIAGPALAGRLADPEVIVRSEAADAVGIIGYQPAVRALRTLLETDPEALVRASAAESLGDLGDTSAVAELEAALLDPDVSVRAYAAGSLGLVGSPRLLPAIHARALAEPSPRVKAELHGAGYRLGSAGDLEALLEILETADESLATSVINMIDDLVRRNRPPALDEDATILRDALEAVNARLDALRPEIDEILARLGSNGGYEDSSSHQ